MARIAVVDERGTELEVDMNVAALRSHVLTAKEAGCDLVVFAECYLTGYALDEQQARSVALAEDGEAWAAVARTARDAQMFVAAGAVASRGDSLANTVRLYRPDGTWVAYDKVHVPPIGADRWVTPNSAGFVEPVATSIGRIGLAICYDIRFPEAFRTLALASAQLIVVPACYPAGSGKVPGFFPTVRAMENGVAVAMAAGPGEHQGTTFVSGSQIVDRDGVSAGRRVGALIVADLDLESSGLSAVRTGDDSYTLDLAGDRRPDHYRL